MRKSKIKNQIKIVSSATTADINCIPGVLVRFDQTNMKFLAKVILVHPLTSYPSCAFFPLRFLAVLCESGCVLCTTDKR